MKYKPERRGNLFQKIKESGAWKSFNEILSPKETHDPETHFANFISQKNTYDSEPYLDSAVDPNPVYNDVKKENIWDKIKSIISPTPAYYTEHRYSGPVPIIPSYQEDLDAIAQKSSYADESYFSNPINSNQPNEGITTESIWDRIKKADVWSKIKAILPQKATFNTDSYFNSFIAPKVEIGPDVNDGSSEYYNPYVQKEEVSVWDKVKKSAVWNSVKEILSPKTTFDPKTHLDNFISFQTEYDHDANHESAEYYNPYLVKEGQISIWEKLKSAILPEQPLYTEHHYSGPLPIVEGNEVESNPSAYQPTIPSSQDEPNYEYVEIYKNAANGLLSKIKQIGGSLGTLAQKVVPTEDIEQILSPHETVDPEQHFSNLLEKIPSEDIKETIAGVLKPMQTSDPETHFSSFINDPVVSDIVQKVNDTPEQLLTRVSEISRKDIVDTAVAFWKTMYQLLFFLVVFIILTPFGIDIMTEGGLV